MPAYVCALLLVVSNIILSPCVNVWRYPECRYTLMAFCTSWNRERPQVITGRLDQNSVTYNVHCTSEMSPSAPGAPLRVAASMAMVRTSAQQGVGTLPGITDNGNALVTT